MKENIKKILKKILIVAIFTSLVATCFALLDEKPTFADSGFSTSHSSSSHSSSHSSSSHRSSSSSHRSSSSGSSYSGSSSGSAGSGIVSLIIFVIFIIIVIAASNKNKGTPTMTTNINDSSIEQKIKQTLPNFNKQEFLKEGFAIYKDVQDAWMNFKLEDIKDKLTDELYNMYESQLTTLEVKGEQNIMKGIELRQGFLKDVSVQNDTITITAGFIIDQYDYIVDANTKKCIRGEANRKMRVTYEMKFRETLNKNAVVDHCPNCGAKLDINAGGTCEYCGSKIVSENTKWVLTEKKALNQRYI